MLYVVHILQGGQFVKLIDAFSMPFLHEALAHGGVWVLITACHASQLSGDFIDSASGRKEIAPTLGARLTVHAVVAVWVASTSRGHQVKPRLKKRKKYETVFATRTWEVSLKLSRALQCAQGAGHMCYNSSTSLAS